MTSRLVAVCFSANDPVRLARFWSGVLGGILTNNHLEGVALRPADDTGFQIRFRPTRTQKTSRNQMHFDLTSTSHEMQRQTVARSIELGARPIDIGQRPEEGHVVLSDPEGNEFCVIEAGNRFLADCGFLGAVACEGTQRVGYFWSEALGWPLVWDQDQETAIRSPHGGPKLTWGGEPPAPETRQHRLQFDVAPQSAGALLAEIERVVSLGATRSDVGTTEDNWVTMTDPDGNEFRMLDHP